jgi:ribosomal protein S18 acetylase RimI-like enzyme
MDHVMAKFYESYVQHGTVDSEASHSAISKYFQAAFKEGDKVPRGTAFYQDALDGSWCSRSAYFGGQLVGFVRVISDGRLHAFVTEMIVHPEFQHRGIGAALLSSILDDCRDAGIADVQLFSAKGKSLFYKKLGFSSRPEDAPGMQLKAAT